MHVNFALISYRITPMGSVVLFVGERAYVTDDPECRWVVIRENGTSFCRYMPDPLPGELVLMVR
jgi:acetone carboxylase gamma subunit